MTSSNLNLGEAAGRFLSSLPPEKAGTSQQAVYQFVRWFGRHQLLARIKAPEIANYAQRISSSDAGHSKKLDLIRDLLSFAWKQGWTKTNLATHIKARKEKSGATTGTRQGPAKSISLTRQGYNRIKQELAAAKEKRLQTIDEISRAAADKDFRENAPLDAAREQLAQIEGRIRELEQTLKSATLVENRAKTGPKAGIGDSIVLIDLASGEELNYTIVSPKEIDPARGKISSVSPLGRAIAGRIAGEEIEIIAPAGRRHYRIEKVSGKGQSRY